VALFPEGDGKQGGRERARGWGGEGSMRFGGPGVPPTVKTKVLCITCKD